jgi:putative transcriptional regulator
MGPGPGFVRGPTGSQEVNMRPNDPTRPTDFNACVGTSIRKHRFELGLTQQSLADRVGVSRQTIINIETKPYMPSVFVALKIAQSLNVKVNDIWGSLLEPPSASDIPVNHPDLHRT